MFFSFLNFEKKENLVWERFDENLIQNYKESNNLVFVDFTADWCVTCKFNKFTALDNKDVIKFFLENDVKLVRGDWTKKDEKILNFLKKYERFGVPVNIIYSKNMKDGLVLPEILTKNNIIENFERIKENETKKGDCFPNVKLFRLNDGSPEKISSADLFNKKIVLVGVPGAFTPTCTNEHLPGYIKHFDSFKSKGIDDVYFISVNDPFVMQKWGDSVEKNDLKFLADSDGEFMSSSGLMTDLSAAGLGKRLSRFSMLVDNGLIKEILDENGPGLEKSTAEILLENI